MIACPDGVYFVRSIKRILIESRWGEACIDWIKCAPWNRYKDAEDADGDISEGIAIEEGRASIGIPEKVVFIETKDKVPRELYITKKDVEKHGSTKNCSGCSSWSRGLAR